MNVALRGLTALVGGTALALSVVALATPASAATAGATSVKVVDSCNQHVTAGHFACYAIRRTDVGFTPQAHFNAVPQATPSGYGPSNLQSAYNLASAAAANGAGQRVYIIDAYDDPNAASDLNTYRTQYGLPSCTTANGCFQKLNQNGADEPVAERRHRLGRRGIARPRHGVGDLPEVQHHADRGQRRVGQPVHRGEGSRHVGREVRVDELGRSGDRQRVVLRLVVLQVQRRRLHRLDR